MKLIRVLANHSFRNIWLGSLLSQTGSQVSRIGLILYVFNTSGSVLNLALLVTLEMLPGAVIAPLAGAVIDRASKGAVMIAADLARMAVMLAIVIWPTMTVIYVMAALHSIATAFHQPAKTASIPLIVRKKDLSRANGIDQSASNLVLIVGPVIGAELAINIGLSATLIVDALSFLASSLFISQVKIYRVKREEIELSVGGAVGEIKEGWNYLARHRLALHLNVLLFIGLLCTGTWMPLAPFFVRDYLGGTEELLGWQLGIFGLGAVLGGAVAPRVVDRFGTGATLFGGFLGEAVCESLYALVPNARASTVIIFFWGIAVSVASVPFYSILQSVVDERFFGRVFSVVKQSESLAVVLAMAVAVLLQNLLATHLVFLLAGLFYLGFAAASSLSNGGRALLATR
ncbi:MAG TPA: MFS transporter [Blastocatellia bacterium]